MSNAAATTDATFMTDVLKNPLPVLVDFWAEWCGPCRMVGPVVEELAMEYAGKVSFAKCNTDDNPLLSGSFTISAIPTLLFFRNGALVERVTGAYPKDALKKVVERAFGPFPS